jgi:hypothetical protein
MVEETFTGGCRCGAIRYEIDRIFDVVYCHCNRCRKSGATLTAVAAVAGDAFRLTRGAPTVYATSDKGRGHFCGTCGSSLYGEYHEPGHLLARDGRYYSVQVGTLDDPERVRPQIHQFIESKLSWLELADDLPRIEGNRLPHPDKRGHKA